MITKSYFYSMTFLPPTSTSYFKLFFTYFLFIFAISCKSKDVSNTNKKNNSSVNQNTIVDVSYNIDKTLKMEIEYSKSIEAVKDFKFKVIEIVSENVILEDTFRGTKLVWNSKNSLKGFLYVGTVQQESENPNTVEYQNQNQFKIIKIEY